jgi:hypothetical protein
VERAAVSPSALRLSPRAFALAAALGALACQEDFPLGSWGVTAPSTMPSAPGTAPSGTAGATMTALPPPPPPPPPMSPTCGEMGTPDALNTPGMAIGTTTLYTDWSWPMPVDSLEWDLVMETDPPDDGYYWAHQFSFVNGLSGFLGLQAHGGYADPANPAPVDFTKMAVYWIAGPPSDAQLGDISGKNGRKATQTQYGVQWMTIHAKFDWTACHVYHLRLAQNGTTDAGDVWYGAWILDKTTGVEVFLGQMLIPGTWGQLSALTTTLTTRIDAASTDVPVMNCGDPEPTSGIFGTPTANDGMVVPTGYKNRFAVPARCGTSRFTDLPEGVRQEIGVRPSGP